jgi:hypothetical protein
MNACTLFRVVGAEQLGAGYLNLQPRAGGIGLSSSTMSLFVIAMQVGMWFGYVSFGYSLTPSAASAPTCCLC